MTESDEEFQGKKETFTSLDISRELKAGRLLYYYTCSICGTRYGPKAVRKAEHDGGAPLFSDDHTSCPKCGKQVCTFKCFDRFQKVCKNCLKG